MKRLLKVGEYEGQPDLSLAGRELQMRATRAAIRYRNPETGRRHFCHDRTYRAAFVRSVLWFRLELRRLREVNQGAKP